MNPWKTSPLTWGKSWLRILCYGPALIFAAFLSRDGTPVLRHDWLTLPTRLDLARFTISTLGWNPSGIGGPRVYPTDYLFAVANTVLSVFLGPRLGLFVFGALIGALCIYGARSLAALESNNAWSSLALSLFALFNPWVYVKTIEGHLAMIAAYGALMALAAELLTRRPNWNRAALLLGVMLQLQFFVIGIAACICAALVHRRRPALLPIACGLIFVSPALLGFTFDSESVLATPYNLDWQKSQSIAPVDAAALAGFFTHYLRGFKPIAFDAVWAFVALAGIGILVKPRRRTAAFAAITIAAWVVATGSKGPIAQGYTFAVEHFAPIELYRELYDLLAIVAMGYIAMAAVATSRVPALGYAAIVPALILIGSWIDSPPSAWWVERLQLPKIAVNGPTDSRFALLPDVDPLQFSGRGSGVDPDAFPRAGQRYPLNDGSSAFPAGSGLRRYALTGDSNYLSALGVSRIYRRSWLQTDPGALAEISAVRAGPGREITTNAVLSIEPEPELTLLDGISVTRDLPQIGSNQIFYGDVAGLTGHFVPTFWKAYPGMHVVHATALRTSASKGWVDARAAFAAQPELAQALGGVVTTSNDATLRLGGDGELLVDVRGHLITTDGRLLTKATSGYTWIRTPAGSIEARCAGECIVVARAILPTITVSPKPRRNPLFLSGPMPWLLWTTIPVRSGITIIKYLTGYDKSMIAVSSLGLLPHIRIETAFNGWLVPRHSRELRVVLVDVVAGLQIALELAALTLFGILAWALSNQASSPLAKIP